MNDDEVLVVFDNSHTKRGRIPKLSEGAVKVVGGGGIIGQMSKMQLVHRYEDIIPLENLLEAWREFIKGKRSRYDVQLFERNLIANIFVLHEELVAKTYRHLSYHAFNISDPKPRNIHKASVRDRLLHHAIYRVLYPFFDQTFIHDSYSCRLKKGTHRAINRFRDFSRKVSRNNTRTAWVLKCDIKKFFASIDQDILIDIFREHITGQDIIWLLITIIKSFQSTEVGKGLPLGNLTSQLLVNIYMNKFDHFMKHHLKARYYIRYADDFVIVSDSKNWLLDILPAIKDFLWNQLRLTVHPEKLSIETIVSGIDFLGWVHFPDHRVLRTSTKRRMFKNMAREGGRAQVVQSYIGLLRHGNSYKLMQKLDV